METFSIATIPPPSRPSTNITSLAPSKLHTYVHNNIIDSVPNIYFMDECGHSQTVIFYVKLEMKKKSYNIAHMLALYEA